MSDKPSMVSAKRFTKIRGIRVDKVSSRTPEPLQDEAEILIDELGYSWREIVAEGIRSFSSKAGLINRTRTIAKIETPVSGES